MRRPQFATTLISLTFAIFASARAASAQQPETRVVPVTALAPDGKPLMDLHLRNIRVNGVNAQIKDFSLDTSPRRIVLLLDASGSMGISNGMVTLWQAAVHSAGLFLNTAVPADWFSVHVFAERDKEIAPFTDDLGAVRSAIRRLPGTIQGAKSLYGATNVGKALNSALYTLADRPGFGDAIIIFSDGRFPRSDAGDILSYFDEPQYLEDLRSKLGARGIRVFFVLAGDVLWTPPLYGVELFMAETGGESFEFTRSDDSGVGLGEEAIYSHPEPPIYRSNSLQKRAAVLCGAIQNTYRLELQFNRALAKPERLHLKVVDENRIIYLTQPSHSVSLFMCDTTSQL